MTKLRFYLTVILPIALSVVAGIVIVILNFNSILHTRTASDIEQEKSDMKHEISLLKDEQKDLAREEAEYDKIIEDNETMVAEIEALKKELEAYNEDVERVSANNAELEKTLSEKQAYLAGLGNISAATDGSKYVLKDDSYKCPSDIPAGKYRAEGKGTLYLRDISNRMKDKADLSTIDTNSYVFEIASGESVKIEGSLTLTALE